MDNISDDEFAYLIGKHLIKVLRENYGHRCEKANFKAYQDHTGFYLECSNATHSYFTAIKACPFCGFTPEKE